jgi:hypothetical protein
MSPPLLLLSLFAVEAGAARISATQIQRAPVFDGRLDDEAWVGAQFSRGFHQKGPHEGAHPTEETAVAVVYDSQALYVAVDCEQRSVPVVGRLTRRDREVEADWVSIALDTRRDGKTAFVFEVNAGGALLDGVRFNDVEFSADWDENWDARVSRREGGWSAEFRIPFRILRFHTMPLQSWGFEVRRYISLKQETDEWALISRSAGGEVSHYGRLEGLRALPTGSPLEIRPFALMRGRRQDNIPVLVNRADGSPSVSHLPPINDWQGSLGLDLKWHLTQAVTLDATVHPDFAQVEADQLVLNLTTYETFYPEKRPFFVDGIEMFGPASFDPLLYTRRIGRAAEIPALRVGERLLDLPQPAPIWAATKLTGRLVDGLNVGLLQALTGRTTVRVEEPGGTHVDRVVAPLSLFSVARLQYEPNDRSYLGLTGTMVNRFERGIVWPTVGDGQSAQSVCPVRTDTGQSGVLVAPGERCFNDAYVAGLDWQWRSNGGTWASNGSVVASLLGPGPARSFADGSSVRAGQMGTSSRLYLGKEGGEHWIGDGWGGITDRKYDNNDVGYKDRGNSYWFGVEAAYRNLQPWRRLLETKTRLEYSGGYSLSGLPFKRGPHLATSGKLDSFWSYALEVNRSDTWFDDRQIGNGAAFERAAVLLGSEVLIQSDATRPVAFNLRLRPQWLAGGGTSFVGSAGLTVRPLPQFDLEFLPTATYDRGEPRYVETASSEFLFGHLEAGSVGTGLRSTYTFSPRLTLQAYAQLFLAFGHYSAFQSYRWTAGAAPPVIHLSQLAPAGPPTENPDFEQSALDANVVLRWEWRLGAVLYLVYARSQVPNVVLAAQDAGRFDVGTLRHAPATDTLILKLSYWWN